MAVTTKKRSGENVPTSSQRQLVDDEQVIQEEEIPNNVVQPNDEVQIDIDDSVEETQEEVNPSGDHIIDIPEPVVQKANALLPKPPPSYPQRLDNQNSDNQFKKFIQMMKITHQVSAIVHSMAPKLEDPGALTILCTIGSAEFAKALCDLMPYLVFKTLGIEQPRPTYMRLQMADRTMKRLLGVIEDVLVRVDKFILSVDFVIIDCEVDYEVPIILGRPFLATGKALCDVEAGELTFWVGDEKVVFHMYKSMRQPNINEVCSFVHLVTDVIIDDTRATINVGYMLEAVLLNFDDEEMDGFMECVNFLQGMGSYNYAP
ncbi:uncharacterized protein [Nicotiana tomentosiformis]|uniref:uncharacterized protein n=1 Tax=Nicotiana tomentosiformis TaxID=4098 RepID=UPI00388CEAD0